MTTPKGIERLEEMIRSMRQRLSVLERSQRGWSPGDLKWAAYQDAPKGWLVCDGSAVSRETYAALFEAIGTTFGAGDGESTFNLPDLTNRAAVGTSNDLGGTQAHDHNIGNHTHSVGNHTHDISTHGHDIASHDHLAGQLSIGNQSQTHSHGSGTLVTGTTSQNHTHNYDSGTAGTKSTDGQSQDHQHNVSGDTGNASQGHTHGISGSTGGSGTLSTGGSGTLSTASDGPGSTASDGPGSSGNTTTGLRLRAFIKA